MRNIFLSNDPAFADRVRENYESIIEKGLTRIKWPQMEITNCTVLPEDTEFFGDIALEMQEISNPHFFTVSHIRIKKNSAPEGEIWRNFHAKPYKLIAHANGKRYLLCGSDYQGFTVIDLDDEAAIHYLPKEAFDGSGWCMAQILSYDQQSNRVKLVGCHWADRYEIRTYDFSIPEAMPWPLLEQRYFSKGILKGRRIKGTLPFCAIRPVKRLRT